MIDVKYERRLHVLGSACFMVAGNALRSDPLALAAAELSRLEEKFASFQPGSVIYRINDMAGSGAFTPLDAESRSLFSYVTALWDKSNHLFDPSVHALFAAGRPGRGSRPASGEAAERLELVGWSGLEITASGARLPLAGMRINLDSCVRPYAVDAVRKVLVKNGVNNALIDLDQDVVSIGKQLDGANWLVGLRHPAAARTAIARIKLNNKGFSIRGNFEQRVTIGGENFGRALSPVDAQPLPGLLSVAVIADNCLTACSAANIARLKTEQAGLRWLTQLGLPWMAIDRQLVCRGPLAPV